MEAILQALHGRVRRGAYRAKPSRRVYVQREDGRAAAAARDRSAGGQDPPTRRRRGSERFYEADFLGCSYGFQPGRGPQDALDALAVTIEDRKVNWVLDADFRDYFTSLDHAWMVKFLEHRIADKRVLCLIQKRLRSGMIEDGRWTASEEGLATRGDSLAAAGERLLALRLRSVGPAMADSARPRRGDRREVCR